MQNDWSELQSLLIQTNLAMNTVQSKETEMNSKIKSAMSNYYKNKKKNQWINKNSWYRLGLWSNSIPKPKIRVKVISKGSEEDEWNYYETLKKYLLEFYFNHNLFMEFVSLLTYKEYKTMGNLFVNYFFENITQKESSTSLNTHIYLLLQQEIETVYPQPCDDFLSNDKFIGHFLDAYNHRNEVKIYISKILKELVNDLEENTKVNNMNSYLTFDLVNWQEIINEYNNIFNSGFEPVDNSVEVWNNIKNKNYESKINTTDEFEISWLNNMANSRISWLIDSLDKPTDNEVNTKTMDRVWFKTGQKWTEKNLKHEFNIWSKESETGSNVIGNTYWKEFILNHLWKFRSTKTTSNAYNYTTREFQQWLQKQSMYTQLLMLYYYNFIAISKFVLKFLENIRNNNKFLPNILKYTIQSMAILITNKYPQISNMTLNSFISKLWMEKIILPTLICPEKNEFICGSKVFSYNTHKSLNTISQVILKLTKGELFSNENNESAFTVFNNIIKENFWTYQYAIDEITKVDCDYSSNPENYITMLLSKHDWGVFVNKYEKWNSFANREVYTQMIKDKNSYLKEEETSQGNSNVGFSIQTEDDKKISNDEIRKIYQNNTFSYYWFYEEQFNEERVNTLQIHTPKEVVSPLSTTNYVNEIKTCIRHVLCNVPPMIYNKKNVFDLFTTLNDTIKYHNKEFDKLRNSPIPISWYSNYIMENIQNLPYQYTSNNYSEWYQEIYSETDNKMILLSNKNVWLTNEITSEWTAVQNWEKLTKYQLKHTKLWDKQTKICNFIYNTKIPICLMNGFEKFNDLYEINNRFINDEDKNIPPNMIFIYPQRTCIHMTNKYKIYNLPSNHIINKNLTHCGTIHQFIKRFSTYGKTICNDWLNQTNETNANEVLNQYVNIIQETIEFYLNMKNHNPFKYYFISKESWKDQKKIDMFLEEIRDFIIWKSSDWILSKDHWTECYNKQNISLWKEDYNYYIKCISWSWVDPVKNLDIKEANLSLYQMRNALYYLSEFSKEKTPERIIQTFAKAIDVIVKMWMFTTGKGDISVDDYYPYLFYLVIQAKPERMITSWVFSSFFLSNSLKYNETGYNLTHINACISFINSINEKEFKMNKAEFDKLCNESLNKGVM